MSNIVRNIVLATALVSATGVSFAARQGAESVMRNPLSISMLADSSSNRAFMGTVEFKVTNNSNSVLKVPYWQLPSASEEGKLFQVFHNGKAADYLGPMIKRPAPTEADMVTFQPYETKLISVDLSKSYDLSKGGDYTVSFLSYLDGARTTTGRRLTASNGRMASLQSVPLKLWVDADNALNSLKGGSDGYAKPGSGGTVVNGVTYVGCSSTQISGAGCRGDAGPHLLREWQGLPGRQQPGPALHDLVRRLHLGPLFDGQPAFRRHRFRHGPEWRPDQDQLRLQPELLRLRLPDQALRDLRVQGFLERRRSPEPIRRAARLSTR